MRELFEISSSTGAHAVRLSDQSLSAIAEQSQCDIIIADDFFRSQLSELSKPVVYVTAQEPSKDLVNIAPIVEQLRRNGLTRNGAILAIGGGVIQDIACFVASVYMRGTRWIYVPTTLLGMVDSCIGGKSSINVGDFKNLVGTFYPPERIIIPPSVTATLPAEHIAAGRAEAAKICFAHGEVAFRRYLELDANFVPDAGPLIAHSLATKKWFIEVDEFDRGERLLLNFGHSFGHALESCTAYALPHGVAVGIGCLAAVDLSCAKEPGLSDHPLVHALRGQINSILSGQAGLEEALVAVDRQNFFQYWDSDKKHGPDHYRPILLNVDACLYRANIPRSEDSANAIWSAFLNTSRALRPAGSEVDHARLVQ